MSELGDLLAYRNMRFASLMKSDDLLKLKADADALKREIKALDDQKKSIESRITALQDSLRRLTKFLETVSSES